MIVWKHHVSKDFENGFSPNNGAGVGGTVQDDLNKLIDYCEKDGREWSIARLECQPEDLEPLGDGWYDAKKDIISEQGFMPLEVVKKFYGS